MSVLSRFLLHPTGYRGGILAPVGPPAVWLLEDFSTYGSTAEMKTNPRGIYTSWDPAQDGNENYNIGQITLDTTDGAPGLSQSMLYSFPIINQSDYTIGVNLKFPTNATEVWVELIHKFSSTFTTLGPASGGADYKFFDFRVDGSGNRFMLFCGTFGTGWIWGHPGDDDGTGSDVVPYYHNTAYAFTNFGTPWDGQWHTYRFHCKIAASGGVARWTFDGHEMPGFANADTSSSGTATHMTGIGLGRNLNKGTSATMQERWGKITVYNADPGWGI